MSKQSERISTEEAVDILRREIPRDHAISITLYNYRHVHKISITSGFELARGKVLTMALVQKGIREWRRLMKARTA